MQKRETKKEQSRYNRSNIEDASISDEIIKIRRVSTKRAGGSSFHFSVLVVAGDYNGKVGVAIAKSKENVKAIAKAKEKARQSMVAVPITDAKSISHEVYIKRGAAKLYLKPAPLGAGIIAGGSVRQILELAGIQNISAKIIGTRNRINNAYALMEAFEKLMTKNKE